MRKLGEKRMKRLGLSVLVVTFLLIGVFSIFYAELWVFIILMVFASFGVSCSRGLLLSDVTQSVSPKEIGKINGYTTTLDSIAQIMGPILGTFLLGINPLYYGVMMGIFALGALLMVFKTVVPFMQKKQFKPLETPLNR
jgi:DHA1 family multidrug resistance protein-like MFS transporter